MSSILGKPNALKQVNLSAIRKVIKKNGSATRFEIVQETKISTTTVRTLLTEMLENKEIAERGYDESIGGRKAVRYQLEKDRFLGAAFCLDGENIHYLLVNVCGEICDYEIFPVGNHISESICGILDNVIANTEIKSIGIGVPGIVSDLSYQRKNSGGNLEDYPIGEIISQRYGLPVLLENDLNAIALGYGRCYLKSYPKERCEDINMAYIHFDKDCVSAGFLAEGRILRGWNHFVGELGLFPVEDSKTLDELLASPITDEQFSGIIAKLIMAVCCILNPQYIAVGGENFRKNCLPMISEYFYGILPDKMAAEIVYAEDKWHDYYLGMAYLTADQIFADVRLIKE